MSSALKCLVYHTMSIGKRGDAAFPCCQTQEACDAIGMLCNTVSAAALQPHHEALLAAIVPVLSHKQWKLRLQSLAALHAVASTVSQDSLCIAHGSNNADTVLLKQQRL